jgi:hypothetical protein
LSRRRAEPGWRMSIPILLGKLLLAVLAAVVMMVALL